MMDITTILQLLGWTLAAAFAPGVPLVAVGALAHFQRVPATAPALLGGGGAEFLALGGLAIARGLGSRLPGGRLLLHPLEMLLVLLAGALLAGSRAPLDEPVWQIATASGGAFLAGAVYAARNSVGHWADGVPVVGTLLSVFSLGTAVGLTLVACVFPLAVPLLLALGALGGVVLGHQVIHVAGGLMGELARHFGHGHDVNEAVAGLPAMQLSHPLDWLEETPPDPGGPASPWTSSQDPSGRPSTPGSWLDEPLAR